MDLSFVNNIGSFTLIVTTLPFVIIAIVFFYIALRGRRASSITKGWPTTTGRVLRSEVELRRSHSSEGGYSSSYYPAVLYEYQVMGQRYQSSTLSPGMEYGLGFQGRVQARVAKYPAGSTVMVYYNPDNPAQAVLEHSATGNRIMGWVAVLILVILACTLVMMFGAFGFAGQFANQIFGQFMPK
jgi:hypothetical protein